MKDLIIIDEFKKPELFSIARLPILTGNKELLLLNLFDLNYIEADGSYSKIFTTLEKSTYYTTKNIGYYEKILPSHSFLRIHNKYIVNLHQIKYIIRNHHWNVALNDKTVLKVSDNKHIILLNSLGLKPDLL